MEHGSCPDIRKSDLSFIAFPTRSRVVLFFVILLLKSFLIPLKYFREHEHITRDQNHSEETTEQQLFQLGITKSALQYIMRKQRPYSTGNCLFSIRIARHILCRK